MIPSEAVEQQIININKFKTVADFLCDKECSYFNCKSCSYFYKDQDLNMPRCLKQNVRDWILYHLEEKRNEN